MTHELNPFDPKDAKKHDVAELLLTAQPVTWDMVLDEVGNFSPRSMGYVIRALEDQKLTLMKVRHAEYGTVYRWDPDAEWDPRYRLSNPNSSDARAAREKVKPRNQSCRRTPLKVVSSEVIQKWAVAHAIEQFG